jgi:hypothetical protein
MPIGTLYVLCKVILKASSRISSPAFWNTGFNLTRGHGTNHFVVVKTMLHKRRKIREVNRSGEIPATYTLSLKTLELNRTSLTILARQSVPVDTSGQPENRSTVFFGLDQSADPKPTGLESR